MDGAAQGATSTEVDGATASARAEAGSAVPEATRVLVAMSGGVDSSVAAALLLEAGHDVAGVTMKLWGGPSDTGCCSVSDTDDARRVANQLGIEHHVFNFGDEFERDVVAPYVADHAAGRTPNPCVECNRHLKFSRLLRRAEALGFDMLATGHHARVVETGAGRRVARGVDRSKDQSYVLHMLDEPVLARLLLPVGRMTKDEVRLAARRRGLVTAAKPDSQDVCFITASAGRRAFLSGRIPLRPAEVVDSAGLRRGSVEALELVTVGQRRSLGTPGGGPPQYVLDVDAAASRVTVGGREALDCEFTPLESWRWAAGSVTGRLEVQTSAHGRPSPATVDPAGASVKWFEPRRATAAGQSVVAYRDDVVVGGGTAARPAAGV